MAARRHTPSSVMYAQLKRLGMSNREAAGMLLNTALTFDGHSLDGRIEDSSQLTRRVVHVSPGEIPVGMFNSFQIVCPRLHRRIVSRIASERLGGDELRACDHLAKVLKGDGARQMCEALAAHDIDASIFRNMLTYIDHAELSQPTDRSLLLLMLFVVTGCTGNPRTASIVVVEYATSVLGADYHTAQTIINTPSAAEDHPDLLLGLVRVIDGYIRRDAKLHVLDPGGTTIGFIPEGRHVVSEVDADVSRNHAHLWRADGQWYLRDLGSTNGTRVKGGGSEDEQVVGDTPVEVNAADTIRLGATTYFFVLPIMGP